jgi:hypothetical protein
VTTTLPPGFESLEPFVATWALDDCQARYERRFDSDMASLTAFYDAMEPLADRALLYLDRQSRPDLSEAESNLFKLVMALAHVALAIERQKQPRPRNVAYPNTLTVVHCSDPA